MHSRRVVCVCVCVCVCMYICIYIHILYLHIYICISRRVCVCHAVTRVCECVAEAGILRERTGAVGRAWDKLRASSSSPSRMRGAGGVLRHATGQRRSASAAARPDASGCERGGGVSGPPAAADEDRRAPRVQAIARLESAAADEDKRALAALALESPGDWQRVVRLMQANESFALRARRAEAREHKAMDLIHQHRHLLLQVSVRLDL